MRSGSGERASSTTGSDRLRSQARSQRRLIVPAEARITVRLEEKHDDLYLSLDGQVGLPLAPGAELRVMRSELTARMVRHPQNSFYDLLRRKLRWGGGGS